MENIRSDLSSALSSSNVSKDELTTRRDYRSFEYFITTSMWRTRNAYKSQLFGLCSSAPIDCTTNSDLKFKNSAHYFGEHLALALQVLSIVLDDSSDRINLQYYLSLSLKEEIPYYFAISVVSTKLAVYTDKCVKIIYKVQFKKI